jgi:ornithine cyclodeaminase
MQEQLGVSCAPAETAAEALGDASLVLTVTTARSPVVHRSDISDGATILAVGSDGPNKQELEATIVADADKVVVDRRSQCVRLGELHHAVELGLMREVDVYAELGDIVVGSKPGREADELIVCDLTGVGAQDAAIAELAWSRIEGSPH